MIHVIISGDVQMVGFRQHVKSYALKHNIKGWVKNLSNGSVEAMFVGAKKDLAEVLKQVKDGPFLAKVTDVRVEEIPDIEFENFEIIRD